LITILKNQAFSSEKPQKLPKIIITTNRIKEPLKETTRDVTVITEKEIKKMNVK